MIIDHGMGVQSLYGAPVVVRREGRRHGDEKARRIGRSGMTGLAGGDHLHFTMLVNGQLVNPVEWWDPHWMQDRVDRKLREAGPSTSTGGALAPAARGTMDISFRSADGDAAIGSISRLRRG